MAPYGNEHLKRIRCLFEVPQLFGWYLSHDGLGADAPASSALGVTYGNDERSSDNRSGMSDLSSVRRAHVAGANLPRQAGLQSAHL
jgi:hypothetical protein